MAFTEAEDRKIHGWKRRRFLELPSVCFQLELTLR